MDFEKGSLDIIVHDGREMLVLEARARESESRDAEKPRITDHIRALSNGHDSLRSRIA
jgi:hypothetical protein